MLGFWIEFFLKETEIAIPNNRQLDKFAKALFQHPFRTGVFKPSNVRHAHTPGEFLKEFAEHYEECCYSLCMGYHTAFLIAYFSHLSQEALSELISSLNELNYVQFLKRAQFFIEREARNGCLPKEVFVKEIRNPDAIVSDLSDSQGSRRVERGRTLAVDTRATEIRIEGFIDMGEIFMIPGIAPEPQANYLSTNMVAEIMKKTVEGKRQ